MLVTALDKSSSDAGRMFGGAGILAQVPPWSVLLILGGMGVNLINLKRKILREKSNHIHSSTPACYSYNTYIDAQKRSHYN